MKEPQITKHQILEYEAANSLAPYISWNWAQELLANYLVRKVERKWLKYWHRKEMHKVFSEKKN